MDFIRSSDLDLLLTCPRKYQLIKLEGLKPDEDSLAQSWGHAWHLAQHLWRLGMPYAEALQVAVKDFRDPSSDSPKTKEKLLLGLRHYNRVYGGPLQPVSHRTSEQEFLIRLPGISVPVKGTMDIIAMWDSNEGRGKEKWIVDHKTTARLDGDWVRRYSVSNQFKCYFCAGREEHPDLAGVLVDVLHVTKGLKSERGQKGKTQAEVDGIHLYRLPVRFTDFILEEWKHTVAAAILQLDLYKKLNYYPMNAPTACGAYGSNCPMLDICACQQPDLRETIKAAMRKANEAD